ncbi:glycosyltransferase family 2 protein [Paenibacillus prosopidis]|uniref:Glycosyl transferase family 2 n=1 Tax=Paenibacillus prosopidis TaxID=630520 RepID=A0A368VZB1_9BACL|nr:glycosyltransferase family A protein [Paenibacillus prosopidis]RCW44949.1 glycosyl transferase family 2 [Paenibacillus prosopidis]
MFDNGSTDVNTIQVLKQLNMPKVRVVLIEKNKSLPNGRNFGINLSRGKYILPLDADDMVNPTMIEKLYQVLENKPEVGFVTSGLQYFGELFWEWLPQPFERLFALLDEEKQ